MNNNYFSNFLYFNRYSILRYLITIFFFINLYWIILSLSAKNLGILVPIFLFIVDIIVIFEQTSKYWNTSNRLKITKYGNIIQIIFNLLLIFICLTGYQKNFFPFLNESGKTFLILLLLVGLFVGLIVEWIITRIEHDKDSYFAYIKSIEKNSK